MTAYSSSSSDAGFWRIESAHGHLVDVMEHSSDREAPQTCRRQTELLPHLHPEAATLRVCSSVEVSFSANRTIRAKAKASAAVKAVATALPVCLEVAMSPRDRGRFPR